MHTTSLPPSMVLCPPCSQICIVALLRADASYCLSRTDNRTKLILLKYSVMGPTCWV
jgi:hypothetical protein